MSHNPGIPNGGGGIKQTSSSGTVIGSLFENGIEKPTTGGGGVTVESIFTQKKDVGSLENVELSKIVDPNNLPQVNLPQNRMKY